VRDGTRERPTTAGEHCTCGRQAVVVFITEAWGEVGWCGHSDGARRGRCVFCSDPAGHPEERCLLCSLRPDTLFYQSLRPDSGPGPEVA